MSQQLRQMIEKHSQAAEAKSQTTAKSSSLPPSNEPYRPAEGTVLCKENYC